MIREEGAALVVVLWALALIGAAAVTMTLVTGGETLTARNAVANAEARLAAESGVQLGLRRLLAGASVGRRFDGKATDWTTGPHRVAIAIRDEEGKLDLNVAPYAAFERLFRFAGAPPRQALALACVIAGRRGARPASCIETTSERPGAVALFAAVEELRHLPGMTDALYGRAAPHVTVYSGAAQVDPRVAAPEVLRAIPVLSEGAVEQLVALRDGGDMGVEELLRDRAWFVRSSGQSFTITAEATARSGARHRAEMVVRLTQRSDRPYIVLAWREPASGW